MLRSTTRSLIYLLGCLLWLGGCEGGKSRGADCGSGRPPYTRCEPAPTSPCPSGQIRVDGVCKVSPQCPSGTHLQNGECVPDSLTCGEGRHLEGDVCVEDQLQVEVLSQSICRNPRNGATRVILQFITRDESGLALDPAVDANGEPTAIHSQVIVDNRPADVESLLSRDSELLKSNLVISLVLDATVSMLSHNPPAFEPMKAAAVNVLQELQQTWQANDAQFHWELTWFDSLIFRPAPNNRGANWSITDISSIPNPVQGTFTGLWKAVHFGIGVHEDLYDRGVASGARDQHVMVVFSDGDNNDSHFDNSATRGSGDNGMLFWTYSGYAPTTLDDIKTRIAANPDLRIHVIAFGDQIGAEGRKQLQEIARLSRGQYFAGSGGNNLEQLFNSVKREFITMQTLGLETPLNPAQAHSFSLRAEHIASGAQGSYEFALTTNQPVAECAD
jgi:hypothetical protein